ncbi:uncharacterized protein VP01_5025g1 [Puccinia sorghi]|uniref:Uncharacterized protein n=1 Tax=Puccinia sorghi TaxID=27349 RepID=A0A0L6UMD9_9BASI|nr:uncharacterized protein VP01_5025g1 [Puccinia sorghi]
MPMISASSAPSQNNNLVRVNQEFHMTRGSFLNLCEEVFMNLIFPNDSPNPQRSVLEQMMVALERLGTFGNAASVGMLATFLQNGKGTVEIGVFVPKDW